MNLSDVTTYYQHYYATNINVRSVCSNNVVVYSVEPTTEAHLGVYSGSSILYADMSLAIGERTERADGE